MFYECWHQTATDNNEGMSIKHEYFNTSQHQLHGLALTKMTIYSLVPIFIAVRVTKAQ